jgi:hypothetical protein
MANGVNMKLWEPPTRQFYPYFPAFESPAVYPITVGQTSANLDWLALGYTAGRLERGLHSASSLWIQRRYSDNEQVRTDLPTCIEKLRVPASRLRERSHRVKATRQTGSIGSSTTQPSRRASIALTGLHSVPATSSGPSRSSFSTSYEQRPLWPTTNFRCVVYVIPQNNE